MDGGHFLYTECHDKIISIQEVKAGSYQKMVEKMAHFSLEIGLPVPHSSNSPDLLYLYQNNASV